jgi:hypothetical protein
MKTQTLERRSRLNAEEMGLNCYTLLKGAPEIEKLYIIFHSQHVFLSKDVILWAYCVTKKCVKDRHLVS